MDQEGSIPDKSVWFVFFDNKALWREVNVVAEMGKPGWKGDHIVIFGLFDHGFHYFFRVFCNGGMVAILEVIKKVGFGTGVVEVCWASRGHDSVNLVYNVLGYGVCFFEVFDNVFDISVVGCEVASYKADNK